MLLHQISQPVIYLEATLHEDSELSSPTLIDTDSSLVLKSSLTRLENSQLLPLLPLLDSLECIIPRPSDSSGGSILLKSLDVTVVSMSFSKSPSSSSTVSCHTGFLPISMSWETFCKLGLDMGPFTILGGIAGSFGTFSLKLFLDKGTFVQNTSMKFPTIPLLKGFSCLSYRYLKFS